MTTPGADLRTLFQWAISLPPGERAAFIRAVEEPLRRQLEELLDADERARTFFDSAVAQAVADLPREPQLFGAYQTEELIGRGGMGAVFRARRTDGEIDQQVAIKVVEHAWLDPRALDRFRQERQFLAGLSHPNIGRLLDGGTRPDGMAYLVMEYVDGTRIDRYCDEHRLGLRGRIRLTLPLCDAVEHAHRKLIVHRDLKPANVLVDKNGIPKLLDFGIAKALGEEPPGVTQTLALTPDFASPEQALGGEITTATDVYGLGAILYLLLTGKPPHRVEDFSPAGLQRAICEDPPVRPSLLAPELRGDLDNILLKALNPEPLRRYGSARELAEDLERFLENRPVLATPESTWYRIRKFVARNKFATAAALLAVTAIVAGTAVSVYEAQRARQGFAEVRQLADKFIFDFEDSIRETPGTLEARKKMVTTAREYLSRIDRRTGSDPQVLREIAYAHFRLADMDADAEASKQRIHDLTRARDILHGLGDDFHGAIGQRTLYVRVLGSIVAYESDHDPKATAAPAEEALRVARALYADHPGDPAAIGAMVDGYIIQSRALVNGGRVREGHQFLLDAVKLADEAIGRFPSNAKFQIQRVEAGNRISVTYRALGNNEASLQAVEEALRISERVPPGARNGSLRDTRLFLLANRCSLTRRLIPPHPELRASLVPACRAMYEMAKENLARDPGNPYLIDQAYTMYARYANQLDREKLYDAEMPVRAEAGGLLDALDQVRPIDRRARYLRANHLASQCELYMNVGRWRDAELACARSDDQARSLVTEVPDDPNYLNMKVSLLIDRAEIAEKTAGPAAARGYCVEAVGFAARLFAFDKDSKQPVDSMEELTKLAKRLGVPLAGRP